MPGPAKKPAHLRAIAGTRVQKTLLAGISGSENTGRDQVGGGKVAPDGTSDPKTPPKKPSWLKDRFAVDSWNRLAAFMTEKGTLNGGNYDALASLCAVNGEIAQARHKGQPVIPSLLAQQARMMLDLHLTGAHSGSSGPAAPPTNPFARNGRRPG